MGCGVMSGSWRDVSRGAGGSRRADGGGSRAAKQRLLKRCPVCLPVPRGSFGRPLWLRVSITRHSPQACARTRLGLESLPKAKQRVAAAVFCTAATAVHNVVLRAYPAEDSSALIFAALPISRRATYLPTHASPFRESTVVRLPILLLRICGAHDKTS